MKHVYPAQGSNWSSEVDHTISFNNPVYAWYSVWHLCERSFLHRESDCILNETSNKTGLKKSNESNTYCLWISFSCEIMTRNLEGHQNWYVPNYSKVQQKGKLAPSQTWFALLDTSENCHEVSNRFAFISAVYAGQLSSTILQFGFLKRGRCVSIRADNLKCEKISQLVLIPSGFYVTALSGQFGFQFGAQYSYETHLLLFSDNLLLKSEIGNYLNILMLGL